VKYPAPMECWRGSRQPILKLGICEPPWVRPAFPHEWVNQLAQPTWNGASRNRPRGIPHEQLRHLSCRR